MGNSTASYADSFNLRTDLPEDKRGSMSVGYMDFTQFPLSGVIGVSSTGNYFYFYLNRS